ncbi:VOC family protein [Chitiniphilus purpureus]|uniref:VOC family protein n=1 Tax=Chitiniphilus purpureus TaxID=2981137 RepID=A0ABY6DM25_9NEIS|nr:VOC family protein [Chitiniphilus sp. CD1]UXY15429.1 VOC family protein [Chitiniphilus sp. CD1]
MPLSQLTAAYPLVTTPHLAESRDFFVRHLGFEVGFEATWFVWLSRPTSEAGTIAIAFMLPEHPSRPPGPETFNGQGLLLTLQVDDARAEEARLRREGVAITYPVQHEPWGQIRFQVRTPSGLVLDIVQQAEPAPGFWDPYLTQT